MAKVAEAMVAAKVAVAKAAVREAGAMAG